MNLLFLLQRCLFLVFLFSLGDGSLLVLLVLRNQIVHVRLGLSELHLVHTLAGVPMQESLTLRNMAVNWSPTRLNNSWIEVLLPTKVERHLQDHFGGMEQRAVCTLLGIHSTK